MTFSVSFREYKKSPSYFILIFEENEKKNIFYMNFNELILYFVAVTKLTMLFTKHYYLETIKAFLLLKNIFGFVLCLVFGKEEN